MLFQIAWRNVLRNKKRSLIIIAAITCGLWAGLVASSVTLGFSYETVKSALETRLSHIQIHQRDFSESHALRDTIPGGIALIERIRRLQGIRAVSGRLLAEGMASTAETATGILIAGIDSDEERRVTTIGQALIEGTYATGSKRHACVIGEELAEKLAARVGSKIVVTTQDIRGNLVGGSFRVAGIFRTDSTPFDGSNVFVNRREIARLLGMEDRIHEIAILLDNAGQLESSASDIRRLAPGPKTETWTELAPELRYISEYTEVYLNLFLYVIVFALLFGIMNTMLMSVLDRIREFGVLTAVGMKGRKIFTMIMLESVILSALGAIVGMVAGWGTVEHLKRTGINLATFGEGLRQWGYAEISYPILPLSMFEQVIVSIVVAAVIGAVYPAWKAIRLDPAMALRTY
ncbi:MAG: ABC transporter permease [Bacteroidetes bacterium]|nr:ABC transporter permease [Bacteroidota bacterium]